ncbi:MAG: CHASE2 domain-containing protein, partial [Armatimonadetes bacterium]|nr:CHASE2 domain-containing protein [Armatimonadota bacterium]
LSVEDRLAFRNAAVLIGPLGDVVDVHRGPGGEYDGMEIHAHALATLLEGRPLRRFPLLVEVLLTLGTGLSFHWLKLRTRTSVAVGVLAVLVILGVGHGAAGWAAGLGWMLPQVGPSLALVGVALAHYGVRLVEEKSARDLAEGVLGRQVDLRVATALLGGEAANDLGGVQQEVTVLFTDLRGFTSLADKAEDPQLLFELLSRYLDRMAECVRLEEGTLDKFVGDAVMAFWNAPFGQPDHAARAVRCALQMRDRLAELNTQLEEERRRQPDDPDRPDEVLGRLEFRMGVGINTGVVTVGQLGSRRRMNYTVIGSPVNLAARLESATKELGGPSACEILIGDATYQALNPATRGNQWERQGLQLKGLGATQVAWRYVPLPQEKDSSHAETNRTQ